MSEMKTCEVCGAKVKDENLRRHYLKVHPTLNRAISKLPKSVRVSFPSRPAKLTRTGKYVLAMVAVVIAIVILLAVLPRPSGPPGVGKMAPDFTLTSTTGQSITLSSYRGHSMVLVEFMDVDCPFCQQEAPTLASLYANHSDVAFLSVDINFDGATDTPQRVADYQAKYANPWPVMIDPNGFGGVAKVYAVTGTPTIFVINLDGTVKWSYTGVAPYSTLAAQL